MADVDTGRQTTETVDTATTPSNGAQTGTITAPKPDVVSRVDFDKEVKSLINQRQELKSQLQLSQDKLVTREKEMTDQMTTLKTENDNALLDIKAMHSNELRTRDFVENVMQDVAPGSREEAKLLLDGMTFRGDFNPLNQEKEIKTLAQEARDRIAKLRPGIYTNSTLQTVTTSTPGVEWDKYTNWGEVPHDMRGQVPDEHFNRLTRTTGTGRKLV